MKVYSLNHVYNSYLGFAFCKDLNNPKVGGLLDRITITPVDVYLIRFLRSNKWNQKYICWF